MAARSNHEFALYGANRAYVRVVGGEGGKPPYFFHQSAPAKMSRDEAVAALRAARACGLQSWVVRCPGVVS